MTAAILVSVAEFVAKSHIGVSEIVKIVPRS